MKQPCFGTEYYPAGMFCKACPEKTACEEATKERHNIQGPQNNNVGSPVYEAHVQETPAIIFPNGGVKFTPEVAVGLVKKKVNGEHESDDPHKRGPSSKLKIPYPSGSSDYVRAYYWCKKLNKPFSEIKEDFESGKLGIGRVMKKPAEKPAPVPTPQVLPPIPTPAAPTQVKPVEEKMVALLEKFTDLLGEASIMLATMNDNVAAMSGNVQSVRKSMEDLRADMRRYSGGKSHGKRD